MRRIITLALLLAASVTVMQAQTARNVVLEKDGTFLYVKMDVDLQSAKPRAYEAVVVVPQIKNGARVLDLQPLGLYSRSMWYNYVRSGTNASGDVSELQFRGHAPETVEYERVSLTRAGCTVLRWFLKSAVRDAAERRKARQSALGWLPMRNR